jgi:hypothetical protein
MQLYEPKVPGRGLEPLRISPPDPKSGASANFATLAIRFRIVDFRVPIANDHDVANWPYAQSRTG